MSRPLLPPNAISEGTTHALMALLRVHARDGRATIRSVAREAQRSPKIVHEHMIRLHDEGLVCYESDRRGALHPLVGGR